MIDQVVRFLNRVLNVPLSDPDEARRRRLLNVLLLCAVTLTLVETLEGLAFDTGLASPPWGGDRVYLSVLVVLAIAFILFLINRYWSRRLAATLFLVLLVISILLGSLDDQAAGRGLVLLAVPIIMASVLLRPYASFVIAGLVSLGFVFVEAGVMGSGVAMLAPALLSFLLVAVVSWISADSAERALRELRTVNRELDERVAARTKDLQRRSVQLRTASEVARDATAILDVDKLLDETVHLISERFGFYHAGVFLLDEQGEYVVLRAASSESGRRMLARGHKLSVGSEGIVGRVAGSGERLVVLDVNESTIHLINPDLPETRSEMALPLVSREEVIGVLDVQSTRSAIFTEEDVATLQTMADQLANAIENARLYAAEQQRRQEAETLYRATQALATTLDLHTVFESILSELQQVVSYDSASVQLLQDGRLKIIGGRGFPNMDGLLGLTFDLSQEDTPNSEVMRRRAPFIVDDAPAVYPEFRRDPHAAAGIHSWLGVPLLLGDQLIGMVALDKREVGFYTPEHGRLASAFAAQAAVAIENARLFEEAQRHVGELTALHNIDVAMTSTLDLDEMLQIIYQQVCELLGASAFYIALYDEERGEMNVRFLADQGKRHPAFRVKVDGSRLACRILDDCQPLWIDDIEAEDEEWRLESLPIGDGVRSLMILPLVFRERVIGAISAQSIAPNDFGAEDRRLFSGIAHQAAIALTNAQLYEDVERRLAEANLLQEVVMAAASTLDFDLVLERALKALHRAVGLDQLGFLLPDEEEGLLVSHPSLVGFSDEKSSVPIKNSLAGQVYRSGYPMLIRERVKASDYVKQSSDVSSALAVPVRVGERIVAVLCAESPQEGAFGEDELRLFTTVSGQLGVTLENARLYEEMAQHTLDLRLLAEASAGMIGSLEPHEIVDAMVTALVKRFEAPCAIMLADETCERVSVTAMWGPEGRPNPFQVGHELRASDHEWVAQLVKTRRLVYEPDLAESEWWSLLGDADHEALRQLGAQAVLVLPMLSQERLVGVVFLSFAEPLPEPVDDEIDWAQTLVNQAAVALSNAQLYQRLESQAEQLSKAYSELQEINQLRTELVQNVSHELRTPLGLIKGYVELLAEGDLGRVLESQRAALQVIRERTATLTRLINNLTLLQAVPREALVLEPLSVVDVVEGALGEFRRSAEDAGIAFEIELSDSLPSIVGDRERLELVFGHLIDNAIKFSPGGGTVAIRGWEDSDVVHVSVADEGIGIPPDQLGRIFERFYQVDGSTKRRFGGMGVGLALVWEMVEAHGGDVSVTSEPGEGSTFTVTLPQA